MPENRRHDGETLEQAWDRFVLDHQQPFVKHVGARGRYGIKDILGGHALTNLIVSYTRENPRDAGHWWLYTIIAGVLGTVGSAVVGYIY
jgi:hypothetical protein